MQSEKTDTCIKFWREFMAEWPRRYHLIKSYVVGQIDLSIENEESDNNKNTQNESAEYKKYRSQGCAIMQEFLSWLNNLRNLILKPNGIEIDISVSYCERNCLHHPGYNGSIELFLSPMMNQTQICYVETLYQTRPITMNLFVSKYRPVGIVNTTAPELSENLAFYPIMGVKNVMDGAPHNLSCNIVILVRKEAYSLITKKVVTFHDEKTNTESKRPVWMFTDESYLARLLQYYLGEESALFYVSYVEILPENEALGEIEYFPIIDLIAHVNSIKQTIGVEECVTCGHSENSVRLISCDKCKKAYYCDKLCQQINYQFHKHNCEV